MKIGIIGAMQKEIETIKDNLDWLGVKTRKKMAFFTGNLNNVEIVIGTCYEGKVNSAIYTQEMLRNFDDIDLILNVGVAGAIDKDLNVYDFVVSTKTVEFDSDITALKYDLGYVFGVNNVYVKSNENLSNILYEAAKSVGNAKKGVIATSDMFVSKDETKEMLRNKFNALAADMESGSIAHTCYMNDVDFCSLRVISDTGNEDEYKLFVDNAAKQIYKVIDKFTSLLSKN